MPARPNYEIIDKVKKLLPEAALSHSNNTIVLTTNDQDTKKRWKDTLAGAGLVVHDHDRFADSIIVSMWPDRQILIMRETAKPGTLK